MNYLTISAILFASLGTASVVLEVVDRRKPWEIFYKIAWAIAGLSGIMVGVLKLP